MKKICYIISAGDCTGINVIKNEEDLVIAADAGCKWAEKYGITPDYIVGDFDSLGFVPKGENVIVHKPEKDDTDTALAVEIGLDKGYKEFVFFGALGGKRIEHGIANMQLLMYLSKRGSKGIIIEDENRITTITNGELILPRKNAGYFSIFAFDGDAKGVTIEGAKYEVNSIDVMSDKTLGVSNEFVGEDIKIKVEKGTLLIIWNE